MLAACAPHARWVDVFCEPGSPHAFDGDEARAVLEAGRAAGLGLRVHGNQLGHRPGGRAGRRAGRRERRPLHLPDRRRRRRARRRRHRRHPAAGRRVLHPLALPGRAAAARRRRPGRAGDRLQPGHLRVVVDAADDRAGGARDGHDPGRGAVRGHRGRGAGAAPRRRRRARARAAAPTSRCSTPRATCTWPTARASRSPARSTRVADASMTGVGRSAWWLCRGPGCYRTHHAAASRAVDRAGASPDALRGR